MIVCRKSCAVTYNTENVSRANDSTFQDKNYIAKTAPICGGCYLSCAVVKSLELEFAGEPVLVDLDGESYLCKAFMSEQCLTLEEGQSCSNNVTGVIFTAIVPDHSSS